MLYNPHGLQIFNLMSKVKKKTALGEIRILLLLFSTFDLKTVIKAVQRVQHHHNNTRPPATSRVMFWKVTLSFERASITL